MGKVKKPVLNERAAADDADENLCLIKCFTGADSAALCSVHDC